jgi:hypothetical protein
MQMSTAKANQAYDLLTTLCGATETGRESFVSDQTGESPAAEYRFQGSLEFGGKFYNEPRGLRVSCYPEDATPMREAAIKAANKALKKLSR